MTILISRQYSAFHQNKPPFSFIYSNSPRDMNLNLRPNLVAAISSALGVSVLVITDYLTKNHEYDYHHGNMHRSKRDILLNSLGLKTDIHHHIQPNEILHSVNVNDDIDLQGAHKNNSIKLIL